MSVISIAKPPVTDVDQVRKVIAAACTPEEPEGLLHRYVGAGDDGSVRVIAHWESRELALQFMTTRLGPALASVLAPEPAGMPEVTWVDVADSYDRPSLHA
jgi:hypothetical protein